MKKLLAITLLIGSLFPFAASAAPSYCSKVTPGYLSVYNYPTGSYWVSQTSAYPAYYAAHNAFYMSHYHC